MLLKTTTILYQWLDLPMIVVENVLVIVKNGMYAIKTVLMQSYWTKMSWYS